MKLVHKLITGILIFLITVPFLFPKYPQYQDTLYASEWGRLETNTYASINDRDQNLGYIHMKIAFFPIPSMNESCHLNLLSLTAESQSGDIWGNGDWTGTEDDYWNKHKIEKLPALVSAVASGNAEISDIHLSVKIKTGEQCPIANSVIHIEEKLVLKMRYHTLWGTFIDLLMSV